MGKPRLYPVLLERPLAGRLRQQRGGRAADDLAERPAGGRIGHDHAALCAARPPFIDAIRDVAIWRRGLKGEAFRTTVPDQNSDKDGTAFVFDMRFPGQRYDALSGLNQNYFRDYPPGTGR